MSSLLATATALIAKDLGVNAEEVTPDLMRDYRETHVARFDIEDVHGGHITEGLLLLGADEEKAAIRELEGLVARDW